jgi:signal peptidase II
VNARLRVLYGVSAMGIVALDQLTKRLVDRALTLHETRAVVPGLLQLTYVRNRGAVFGFFNGADFPHQALAFALISLVALGLIVLYSFRLPATRLLPQSALALILGGAVGNLIDRLAHGYVIDFLDVYWRTHHWPMFNVADSAISVGVALLIVDMLLEPRGAGQTPDHASPSERTD